MKLHTSLTHAEVYQALAQTQESGQMTGDILAVQFQEQASRSHPRGFQVQLGTYDKTSGPTRSRRYKNSGTMGSASERGSGEQIWAATYDEWGWFIARVFKADPAAKFGPYNNRDDFNRRTAYKYILEGE